MKILVINYEFPPIGGGAGQASYHIAKKLCKTGNNVAVLTSCFENLNKEEFIDGVEVFRIPAIRKRADRCSVFEMSTFILSALIFSLPIVKKFRPDVSLVFFGIPSGPVSLWLKYIFKIPYNASLQSFLTMKT